MYEYIHTSRLITSNYGKLNVSESLEVKALETIPLMQ